MGDIANTSQITSVKFWDNKNPGDGIMASHINELQEEVTKIEREIVKDNGESELQTLKSELAEVRYKLDQLSTTLAGDGLKTEGEKLVVPSATVARAGSVKLANTSDLIDENNNNVVTCGTFQNIFEKVACDNTRKIKTDYISSDLMSTFVFAGILTLKIAEFENSEQNTITVNNEEYPKLILSRNFDAPLGHEFGNGNEEDPGITSCYYLVKIDQTGSEGNPLYSLKGKLYDGNLENGEGAGELVVEQKGGDEVITIDDGAWLQGSATVVENNGQYYKTWVWTIIDRSQEFKIDTPEGHVTQDAHNVFDLRTPLQKVYNRVTKMEDQLRGYHPYYLGVIHTGPIQLDASRLPNREKIEDVWMKTDRRKFEFYLPGAANHFRKMKWWVASERTPVFEALSAVEINTAMETTSGSMVEREPIAYYRRGIEGTNKDYVYSKYLQGWDYANTLWPMYKGGVLFGDWSLGLKDAKLTWDSTKKLWVLSFELYKAFNETQSFTSEGETIYYEFYS